MNILSKVIVGLLILLNICLLLWILLHSGNIAVFNPKGIIASQEKQFLVFTASLGLLIVIPVIITAFYIVWKYREENTSATYTPDWDNNKALQITLLVAFCMIIAVVAVMDWKSSHDLDPFKPIVAKKQLTIQVIAMRWKWLFIYPEQRIATINYIRFPKKTAINFQITADAPMNSFWIPQLGGQVYAMNGMSSQIHLMADETGKYTGRSSNISGDGFAGMTFIAQSTSSEDFDTWVSGIKKSSQTLDKYLYDKLARPSQDNKPEVFTLGEKDLYNEIIKRYMPPARIEMEKHT